MSDSIIRVDNGNGNLSIYINDLLHLRISLEKIVGFQSWIENNYYIIEYTLSTGENILCEYWEFNNWKQMLIGLNEINI